MLLTNLLSFFWVALELVASPLSYLSRMVRILTGTKYAVRRGTIPVVVMFPEKSANMTGVLFGTMFSYGINVG
jgi:hypothetical protein